MIDAYLWAFRKWLLATVAHQAVKPKGVYRKVLWKEARPKYRNFLRSELNARRWRQASKKGAF